MAACLRNIRAVAGWVHSVVSTRVRCPSQAAFLIELSTSSGVTPSSMPMWSAITRGSTAGSIVVRCAKTRRYPISCSRTSCSRTLPPAMTTTGLSACSRSVSRRNAGSIRTTRISSISRAGLRTASSGAWICFGSIAAMFPWR